MFISCTKSYSIFVHFLKCFFEGADFFVALFLVLDAILVQQRSIASSSSSLLSFAAVLSIRLIWRLYFLQQFDLLCLRRLWLKRSGWPSRQLKKFTFRPGSHLQLSNLYHDPDFAWSSSAHTPLITCVLPAVIHPELQLQSFQTLDNKLPWLYEIKCTRLTCDYKAISFALCE